MSDTTAPAVPASEAPATSVETAPAKPAAPAEPVKDAAYWQAEAEKWKTHSRKHEDTSKANADKAKRLDELEEASKSEVEKATSAAAKAQAEAAEAKAQLAIAQAAIKHGLSPDDLDLLGTHGTADEINARAERLAARLKAAAPEPAKPDFGAGDRGGDVGGEGQLTREDMKRMTPDQIVEAKAKGQFAALLKSTT